VLTENPHLSELCHQWGLGRHSQRPHLLIHPDMAPLSNLLPLRSRILYMATGGDVTHGATTPRSRIFRVSSLLYNIAATLEQLHDFLHKISLSSTGTFKPIVTPSAIELPIGTTLPFMTQRSNNDVSVMETTHNTRHSTKRKAHPRFLFSCLILPAMTNLVAWSMDTETTHFSSTALSSAIPSQAHLFCLVAYPRQLIFSPFILRFRSSVHHKRVAASSTIIEFSLSGVSGICGCGCSSRRGLGCGAQLAREPGAVLRGNL
jgi:hypothetical protein